MKQVQTVAALCAVLLVAQAASADPSWFSAETSSQQEAKASSYYAQALETELACLSQMNFRNCRYTGFNPGLTDNAGVADRSTAGRVGDLSVQTDFACCSKEHHYGHREDIGLVGADGKIGTCDWNINLFWWNYNDGTTGGQDPVPTYDQALAPVLTADGSAVKFGTVTATCYFSSAADQCDHPLCERMVLSFQGGIYVSHAYGFETGSETIGNILVPLSAPAQDTCANPNNINLPNWPIFGPFNRQVGGQRRSPQAAQSKSATPPAPSAKQSATVQVAQEPDSIVIYLSELIYQGIIYLGDTCFGGNCGKGKAQPGARSTPLPNPSQSTQGKVKASMANADYAYTPEEMTYAGYALVLSGPFSVVSTNDNQIKQTGIMEFTPTFLATPDPTTPPGGLTYTAVRPTNKWPIVRGQTAKLRFTKEKEEHQGEGKDSYQAHEPDHKDAYYGDNKDYGREYYGDNKHYGEAIRS